MDKVDEIGWCIASALKATQRASKSSWFLACSSCFPVWPFAELLDEGCSFIDFVCMLCCALRGGSVRKNPKRTVSWTGADESRYCQRCEPSNATTQGSTEASKTSCQEPKENLTTESCCWHASQHAEYPNASSATTTMPNLFFVVFYSY